MPVLRLCQPAALTDLNKRHVKKKKGTENIFIRKSNISNKLAIKKINFMYVQVKYTGQGEMRKEITITGVELPCRYLLLDNTEKKREVDSRQR